MINKLLLAAIAFGLWANAAENVIGRNLDGDAQVIALYLGHIGGRITDVADGSCQNKKLCE